MPRQIFRLGTRGSPLARWQAQWVQARLSEAGHAVELIPISTQGDQPRPVPVASLGTQGVFTKEIQRALVEQEIDLAVHSLKDLPTEPVEGITLAAVPERGPTEDALISREGRPLDELPPGATVATGSLRRRAQLWHIREDLQMVDVRGNVDTRLRKLNDGEFDALVLAVAGLVRLGRGDVITQRLAPPAMFPAVGQGALGIEIRVGDTRTASAVGAVDHAPTHAAVRAERTMLAALRGGCLAPVAADTTVEEGELRLVGVVLSGDGRNRIEANSRTTISEAEEAGRAVARRLLDLGADEFIASARGAR